MFNKLTCKVRFYIAVWSLRKSIRASTFVENFPHISAKPIALQRNLLGKLSRNRPFFTNRFSGLENSREIPAKSAVFSANLSLKIPRNLTFFPRPTRSPVQLGFNNGSALISFQKTWCWSYTGRSLCCRVMPLHYQTMLLPLTSPSGATFTILIAYSSTENNFSLIFCIHAK